MLPDTSIKPHPTTRFFGHPLKQYQLMISTLEDALPDFERRCNDGYGFDEKTGIGYHAMVYGAVPGTWWVGIQRSVDLMGALKGPVRCFPSPATREDAREVLRLWMPECGMRWCAIQNKPLLGIPWRIPRVFACPGRERLYFAHDQLNDQVIMGTSKSPALSAGKYHATLMGSCALAKKADTVASRFSAWGADAPRPAGVVLHDPRFLPKKKVLAYIAKVCSKHFHNNALVKWPEGA